jgi:hypothetical protein
MANYLLNEGGKASVPGAAHVLSPYFRISTATNEALLTEAIRPVVGASHGRRNTDCGGRDRGVNRKAGALTPGGITVRCGPVDVKPCPVWPSVEPGRAFEIGIAPHVYVAPPVFYPPPVYYYPVPYGYGYGY